MRSSRDSAVGPGIAVPTYGIDDETAIRVLEGTIDVISEGRGEIFPGDEQTVSLVLQNPPEPEGSGGPCVR